MSIVAVPSARSRDAADPTSAPITAKPISFLNRIVSPFVRLYAPALPFGFGVAGETDCMSAENPFRPPDRRAVREIFCRNATAVYGLDAPMTFLQTLGWQLPRLHDRIGRAHV